VVGEIAAGHWLACGHFGWDVDMLEMRRLLGSLGLLDSELTHFGGMK
jgi:hypothetical protein